MQLKLGKGLRAVSDVNRRSDLGQAAPKRTAARLKAAGEALYEAYQRLYGIIIVAVQYRVQATLADTETAEALYVVRGSAVIAVDRLAVTFEDQAIEWRQTRIRSDHYRLLLKQGDEAEARVRAVDLPRRIQQQCADAVGPDSASRRRRCPRARRNATPDRRLVVT